MAKTRVKTSAYLSESLYERTKIYSDATALPFNTHIVLALEEYLKNEERRHVIQTEMDKKREEEQ